MNAILARAEGRYALRHNEYVIESVNMNSSGRFYFHFPDAVVGRKVLAGLRIMIVAAVVLMSSWAVADNSVGKAPAPLPEYRAEIYKYYKLGWLPDGYPGRYTNNGLVAHPIYGTYVIADYLRQYRKTKEKQYLDAAISVADAGLSRMESLDDAQVFYYYPEDKLSLIPNKFYSALTQARWLEALSNLYEATHDISYKKAAHRVMLSLLIPTAEGGVLQKVAGGASIEEYPHQIPLYTLNGWLTALNILIDYAKTVDDDDANTLIKDNLTALENLLPLYDLPEISNSRYQLTGSVSFRLSGADIVDASLEIPGEGLYKAEHCEGRREKWDICLYEKSNRTRLDAVLSYVSAPAPNVLHLTTKDNSDVSIEIATSKYDPTVTALPTRSWTKIGKFTPNDKKLTVEIPWDDARFVAYPTAFTKKIGGTYYNVYHPIHIKVLRALYTETGVKAFKEYADKWDGYCRDWQRLDAYKVNGISLVPYVAK